MSASPLPRKGSRNASSATTLVLANPLRPSPQRLCFIVEEKYRCHAMPTNVADVLAGWGHDVDVLRPHETLTSLSRMVSGEGRLYDGYILKTVSGGPGMSILEAAGAAGRATVNDYRAVRLARDKAVGATLARAAGLPFPRTWFAPSAALVHQVPAEYYPLVVKPSNGSACEKVYRVDGPADLDRLDLHDAGCLLVQPYLRNPGYDVKLYNTGDQIWATVRTSPLNVDCSFADRLIQPTPELVRLAERVGEVFGLDIYGIDVLETPRGWVVVDVNDFPSFGLVPQAPQRIARTILRITQQSSARSRLPEPAHVMEASA